MSRKKELYKEPKRFVHLINTMEYRDYIHLTKGWLEAKKYAKGKSIQRYGKNKNITMFFIIYSNFMPILKRFKSSKTLNLYIYCGLQANYQSGSFKANYEEIRQFFNCTERAIYKWFKELQEQELIIIKKYKNDHYIFLRPYGIDNNICDSSYTRIPTLIIQYRNWLKQSKENSICFCAIHNDFKKYINKISGGALKLYIYCSLGTNKSVRHKDYGTFYQSLEQISENLGRRDEGTSKGENPNVKTICRWFKELKELHLVEKYQLGLNKASTIYVKPLVPIKELSQYKWLLNLDQYTYVAHSETKTIHHKSCKYAKKISKINRVFFNELKQGLNNGYKLCKVCKGIEI